MQSIVCIVNRCIIAVCVIRWLNTSKIKMDDIRNMCAVVDILFLSAMENFDSAFEILAYFIGIATVCL